MTLTDTTLHSFPLGLPERIAAQLEETETATQNGFSLCVSAVIVALRQHVSGEHEAQALLVTLREENYPHLDPADLEGEDAGRLAVACRGVLGRLFGDRLEGTTDAIARESGLTKDSVRSLLGLSTPLVLSALKDHVFSEQYDAERLSGYLQQQSRIAADKLPDTVLLATGWVTATRIESTPSSGVDSRRSVPPPPGRTLAPQPSASGSQRTLAVAMAALALLGVLAMALFAVLGAARRAASERSRAAAEVDRAVAPPKPLAPAPAGDAASPSPAETPEPVEPETGPSLPEMAHPEAPAEIEVLSEETGAQPLARYATSGESLPRVFVLRDVEPPSGVEGLAPNALLDSVARVLREQPRLHVRIEGHTPPSKGTRAARQLSEQWAEAVKAYLVERGVEAERVEALGRGSAEPIDTNEMPEGRARNRRIQLVVIGR